MKKFSEIFCRFPMVTFIVLLVLLFVVIFVGTQLRAPEIQEEAVTDRVATVETFTVGQVALTPVTAEVDRTDTLTLFATASGIVSRAVWDGAKVWQGQEIVKLADAYNGANASDAATAVAARNARLQDEIYEDSLKNLRDEKDEIGRTGSTEEKIAQRQISINKRTLENARDVARLQVAQAAAQAARYRITAPFAGTVEEVYVRQGDNVNAGQALAVVKSTTKTDVYITAHVGSARASQINIDQEIVGVYNDVRIPLEIINIAKANGTAQSYALTFKASVTDMVDVPDGAFIEVLLPLGGSAEDILIPLDAVKFGATGAEVFVITDGKAAARSVELADVVGHLVIVTEGLAKDDHVILDRNITDGQLVNSEGENSK